MGERKRKEKKRNEKEEKGRREMTGEGASMAPCVPGECLGTQAWHFRFALDAARPPMVGTAAMFKRISYTPICPAFPRPPLAPMN